MMKLCWKLSAATAALAWIFAVVFFVSTDLQMIEPDEMIELRKGKQFWEWHSPHGTFAMHFVEKGVGSDHVLLIHGFRSHTFTWRFLIEPLAKAGYHVWAIDLIGYGLSDKPDNATYDIQFFSDQVTSFMAAHGIEQAHLVGNSMGGGLALHQALLHPNQVSSLSLLNALGYPHELPSYLTIARYISQIWTPFLGPRMVRHVLSNVVYHQEAISEEQVEAYCLPYRLPGGILATLLTLQQYDHRLFKEMGNKYDSLKQPMLIIWGEHDSQIPLTHYHKFLQDFPDARQLLIPDCGHIPQEEHPEKVLNELLKFLSARK